jgi:hypothetical protein
MIFVAKMKTAFLAQKRSLKFWHDFIFNEFSLKTDLHPPLSRLPRPGSHP